MNLQLRRWGASLALPVMLALAVGCPSSTETPPESPAPYGATSPAAGAGGIYRLADQSDVRSLDPIRIADVQSHTLAYNIYNGLAQYRTQITGAGQQLTDLVPDLAESWTNTNGGKTYRFKLKTGVKFHNGRAMTADDIKYSFERTLNPVNASTGLWTGDVLKIAGLAKYQAAAKGGNKDAHLDGVKVVDPQTLEITLDRPLPFALHLLSMPYFYVVPREEVEKYGKDFTSHPVGTGAFKFEEWQRGQYIRLVKNPDYHETGRPYLDEIRYLIVPEESQRFLRFESGELEQSTIPPSQFEKTIKEPKWNPMGADALMQAEAVNDKAKSHIVKAQRLVINYLGLDNQSELFKDVRVRQAFNYGIDKDQVIRILNGRGMAARGVLPVGFPGYKQGRPVPYSYDLAKAKALLQQAGWKEEGGVLKKGGKPFTVTLWYNSGPEFWAKVMASVQADLKKLGIETDIRMLDWAPYLDKMDRGEAQFFRLGWQADYPDPDNFLWTLMYSKNVKENRAKYRNPAVDKLLDQAQREMDWKKREALYQQAEDTIIKEAPWVFLYQPVLYEIFQPYVRGQQLHPLIPYVFKNMKMEK